MYLLTYIFAIYWALDSAAAIPANDASSGGARESEVSAALKSNVTETVNQWLKDIQTVNNFVDTAGDLKDSTAIIAAAKTAFVAAQGEGSSLSVLQGELRLDATGQMAADALPSQFNIIGPSIKDTITNPQNLSKNLASINGARYALYIASLISLSLPSTISCRGHAIDQEEAVQQAAVKAVGATAPPAGRPSACISTQIKSRDSIL